MSILEAIHQASLAELERWLREVENRPEFVNTAAGIKDELRRREMRKMGAKARPARSRTGERVH